MEKLTQDESDALETLHQQEIDGTIKKEHLEVLNTARQQGQVRELSMPDKMMRFVKTPTSKIIGTAGAEIAGENLGGAAVTALGPGKFAKGGKLLGQLLGIAGGNVAGQSVTNSSEEGINPEETVLSTLFGGLGIKASEGITGLRNMLRPNKPTVELTPGVNQLESTPAWRSANRLPSAGIVPRLANVIKNQAAEIVDAIASSAPFSRGQMRSQKESIQKFYENAAENFSKDFVSKTSKLQIGDVAKEILENDVNFALRTRARNYTALDDLAEGVPFVDLSFMNKGTVSFSKAGEILEKASDRDFRSIRKQMKKAVDDIIESHPDDPTVDFSAMKELGLDTPENLAFAKEFNKVGGDKVALSKNLKGKIDTALMFSEKRMKKMKGSFIQEIVRKKPEVFLDSFINPKGPRSLKQAMDVLPKELQHKIQSHFLGSINDGGRGGLLRKASKQVDGGRELDGASLVQQIDNFENGFGKSMGLAMFPGKGLTGLRHLGEELAAMQSKKGTATGSTAIFLMTPGAAITLGAFASGGFQEPSTAIMTAAGVLFLPKYGARKLNDMKFVNKFVNGVKKLSNDETKLQKFLTLLSTQLTAEGINSTFVPGDPAIEISESHIGGSSTN
jgi:hypothetical protein